MTYVFDRAYYNFSWWSRLNESGSYFVTRLKRRMVVKPVKKLGESDHIVSLSKRVSQGRKNPYQGNLRVVRVSDVTGKYADLTTNDVKSSAEELGRVYRKRWQIELFIKWIKQNLKIKSFYGRIINAIKAQVYIAMIGYLLMKILHKQLRIGGNVLEFSRIIRANLLNRMLNLKQIFTPPDKNKRPKNNPNQLELYMLDFLPDSYGFDRG